MLRKTSNGSNKGDREQGETISVKRRHPRVKNVFINKGTEKPKIPPSASENIWHGLPAGPETQRAEPSKTFPRKKRSWGKNQALLKKEESFPVLRRRGKGQCPRGKPRESNENKMGEG